MLDGGFKGQEHNVQMKALSNINSIHNVCPAQNGICLNVYNPFRTKLKLILQIVGESVARMGLVFNALCEYPSH
jgi:hypothetical protein